MFRGILFLAAIYATWLYIDTRRGRLPPDVEVEALREFRYISPEHYESAMDAARAFEKERIGDADLPTMARHAAAILENLSEISMRLPNDARARDTMDTLIRHTEYVLQQDMHENYELCPAPFPIRDYSFHRWSVDPTVMTAKPVQV